MRILCLVMMTGGVACDPVASCDTFPRSDCCTNNEQCLDYYGPQLPFCTAGDRDIGGTCSECKGDSDCKRGQLCVDVGQGQKQCIRPWECYEGDPFPGITPCG